MRVIGALRIKNEARWIRTVLRSIAPLCERTYVLDDHSTDGTPELCAVEPGVSLIHSGFDGIHEARDKDFLLAEIAEDYRDDGQTWVLLIDGDEILEPSGPQKIRELLARPDVDRYAWGLRILYLWDRTDQVRNDGVYGRFYRPSLFRFTGAETFMRTNFGGNFHCSSVPARWVGVNRNCDAALYHTGYMLREDRIRKYEWYRSIDPNNSVEDGYRHVVQGDIPEVPAGMTLRHAGPLELRPLA